MSTAENKLTLEIIIANSQEANFLACTMYHKQKQQRDIILISVNEIEKTVKEVTDFSRVA